MSLDSLCEEIQACSRCELRQGASHPVCGLGEIGSKYFIIGEAPGRDEDKSPAPGVPFIGLAGKRLNKLLALAGINPDEVYLTNVCKCRPPKNRDPKRKEIAACHRWLMEELELVQPEFIITLGSVPLQVFMPGAKLKQYHGTMQEVEI